MNVLVIEKDVTSLSFLKDLLTHSGFEVLTSKNTQEGLEVLGENKDINCIISDPEFSDIDTVEFAIQAASIQDKDSVAIVSPRQFFEFLGAVL